nr:hypothetical protein [uncultured Methanoregula sp.]
MNELKTDNTEISNYFKESILPKVHPKEKNVFPEGNITTIGDTIIIRWAFEPKIAKLASPVIFLWLQRAIVRGFRHHIFLRGAVSQGLFWTDEDNTIIGPAVADASAWCELADWFGVILTPNFRFFASGYFENPELKKTTISPSEWCVVYPDVPTREGKKEMTVVSWPKFFIDTQTGDGPSNVKLSFLFSISPIPKGAESKYENTLSFFKWYEKEIYSNLKMK